LTVLLISALSSSDVDFETFGVLGTTLIEICYVCKV